MESYKWMSKKALMFLDAYLNENKRSKDFLKGEPGKNGVPSGIDSFRSKQPIMKIFSFEDFNEMALKSDYENLSELYKADKLKDSSFNLEEGKLNTLGLQPVYPPNKSRYGIEVFLFALELYPESANLFDSLAEGYLFLDDKKNAIENFEKSLKLNPKNENAIKRLKQLKGY